MDASTLKRFRSDTDRTPEEFQTSHLMNEYSPSIPHDFPSEFIPSENKCGLELLKLGKCIMSIEDRICNREYSDFLICKRDRDIILFEAIKKWETELFRSKKLDERVKYLEEMRKKLDIVENEFQKIPYLNLYKQKKNRFQSDIEQLNWRLNYLKKVQ